jgi:hypothetical protein
VPVTTLLVHVGGDAIDDARTRATAKVTTGHLSPRVDVLFDGAGEWQLHSSVDSATARQGASSSARVSSMTLHQVTAALTAS